MKGGHFHLTLILSLLTLAQVSHGLILTVSQKVKYLIFCESILYLVFSVWLFNKLVYQHIFETKH